LWGDNIADESWPKHLHPYPLSEDYYLVASQPDRDALWGLYLVDRFDKMRPLADQSITSAGMGRVDRAGYGEQPRVRADA